MENPLPYTCIHCDKTFSMNFELIIHLKTHSGEKPYQCIDCDESFALKSELMSHMESHFGNKPYEKTKRLVVNASSNKSSQISQPRIYSGDPIVWTPKSYLCSQCNKSFSKKHSLEIHLRTHTGEKPYQCSQCHKCFPRKSNLITHISSHSGEKPFQCSHCDKYFKTKENLKRHIQMFTYKKTYQCKQCLKFFSRKSNLNVHLRIHSGEKPYQCSHCNQCFTRKRILKKHLATHTNENNHHYNKCENPSTKKSDNLINNRNNNTSISNEPCRFGGKRSQFSINETNSNDIPKSKIEIGKTDYETINIDKICNSKIEIKEEVIEQNFELEKETYSETSNNKTVIRDSKVDIKGENIDILVNKSV